MPACVRWRHRRRRPLVGSSAATTTTTRSATAAAAAADMSRAKRTCTTTAKRRTTADEGRAAPPRRRHRRRCDVPVHIDARQADEAAAAAAADAQAPSRKSSSRRAGAADVLQWLLGVSRAVFFRDYFERRPLHCTHGSVRYFTQNNKRSSSNEDEDEDEDVDKKACDVDAVLRAAAVAAAAADGSGGCSCDDDDVAPVVPWSTAAMLRAVRTHVVCYDADINVVRVDAALQRRVSYTEQQQQQKAGDDDAGEATTTATTMTHDEAASSRVVTVDALRACMQSGWSVRFLRPHAYAPALTTLLTRLERVFACSCSVNSYWTPAASQGFAAHADDVDVFLLQLEGEKEWRLYAPLDATGVLNRYSSEDYTPAQLPAQPLHTLTLRPGDVLYMPRGLVHQGRTPPHTHSLHITFSVSQRHTYADLLQRAAAHTIETLATNRLRWRRTLRPSYARALGTAQQRALRRGCGVAALSPRLAARRAWLQRTWRGLVADMALLLTDETQMDVCADVYARDVLARMQPPPPRVTHAAQSQRQQQQQQHEHATQHDDAGDDDDDGDSVRVCDDAALVRLRSPHACRLLFDEEGVVKLYHNGSNATASSSSRRRMRHGDGGDGHVSLSSSSMTRTTMHTPPLPSLLPAAAAAMAAELRFDAAFAPALLTLWTRRGRRAVALHTLPFPDCDTDEDAAANRQLLARMLLEANVLECVSP